MTISFTRAQLLARGAKGGAALVAGGLVLDRFVGVASADPLPSGDLAYARLLVGAELLASDFYSQAIAASVAGPKTTKYLRRAYANEQEHYHSVAGILSGAGQTPAVSGDITFSFPKGTFASEKAIVKFVRQLETTMLGAYLGAVDGIRTDEFKLGLAQIAASEAQHLSYFNAIDGGEAFGVSFPPVLAIDQASNAMDAYTA